MRYRARSGSGCPDAPKQLLHRFGAAGPQCARLPARCRAHCPASTMAEIARDAILYGGKDVAKAQKAAEDLLQKLVANGCDEAKAAPLSRKAAASLNEARSVIVVLCGEGDGVAPAVPVQGPGLARPVRRRAADHRDGRRVRRS